MFTTFTRNLSSSIRRQLRNSSNYKKVELTIHEEIATLTLQRAPVNSLNFEYLKEINKLLEDVEKSGVKGLILTSALSTTFCAGLDIMELYKPDLKRAEEFLHTALDCWIKYYNLPVITAAAVNGHAPGGGCFFALASEYRAMVQGNYSIGLNETALGMIANSLFRDALFKTLGMRQAELALTTGKRFRPDEALKAGLIDDLATDQADAIEKCTAFIRKFDRIPSQSRSFTKQKIRSEVVQNIIKSREDEIRENMEFIKNPKFQANLENYVHNLKNKSQ